jgi:sensor histidine kinase YesM
MEANQPLFFRYRLWWHGLFWIAYVLYDTWIWGSYDGAYLNALRLELVDLPLKMIAAYLTIYWLLPRFFFRQQYKPFVFWLVISILVVCFSQRLVEYFYTGPVFYEGRWTETFWHLPYFFHCLITIYSVVAAATVIVLLKNWYQQQAAFRQIEKEKFQAELKFLRGQLNPHFLFNTLNNLYAHALKQSEQTPQIVEKLSDLLHYTLYESTSPTVPLSTEVRYLENLIELEKMRFGDRLDLSLMLSGTHSGVRMAPMLLLPLIENSFKHGISRQRGEGWVAITLTVEGRLLQMTVANGLPPTQQTGSRAENGIGLHNLRRRLELLYPNQHQLSFQKHPDRFCAQLCIELNPIKTSNHVENYLSDR